MTYSFSFSFPLFLIPLALTGILYVICSYWPPRTSYGISGMLDDLVGAVAWLIGTLVIWILYLIALLVIS